MTTSEPLRVYIAGPYTRGDVGYNVHNAIVAGNILLQAGHLPYVPHLSHFMHLQKPQSYETWMELDRVWLLQCQALLRLPGDSPGADKEWATAMHSGIPCFAGMEDFIQGKAMAYGKKYEAR